MSKNLSFSLKRAGSIIGRFAMVAAFTVIATVFATAQINFENPPYTLGNINGQDGWTKTGPYDMAVSSSLGKSGFGSQSFRISNSVTSGSFGDMAFSKPAANEAGETGATNGGLSGGVRQNYFEAQFSLTTTTTSQQPGLLMSVSPDRGDGARMSYLRFEDGVTGIHVFFDDVQQAGPCVPSGCANFVETQIATLSRTVPHTIKFAMFFVDGPGNDVVKIYIDGALVHTGTSWEDYFRFDPEASADPTTHTVDSLLFRTAGTAVGANAGNGFLVDNMNISTGPGTASSTVVVNHSDPTNWVLYNDGMTGADPGGPQPEGIDPTCGEFVNGPGTTPLGVGSAQIRVTGARRCNLATYQFAGTPLSEITELAYSTYNPSAGNGGSASRSGFLQFNVDFNGTDTWQRRLIYLPSDNGSVLQNTWQQWDAISGGAALWRHSGPTWPGTGIPGTTPRTWNDILTSYPGVRIRVTDSFLGIRVGEPYPDGYTENIDGFKFGTGAGTTWFDFEPATTQLVVPVPSPNAFDNDYTRINNAIQAAPAGSTVMLAGTFNWTEPNAALSWSKGSDSLSGTPLMDADNYSVLPPGNRNGITVTAASLGSATIQGPGDLPGFNLEGVFQFYPTTNRGGGNNQNWTISNLRFLDFDNPIGFYFDTGMTSTSFNGTQIVNNYILLARDLNATVAPADANQNIGIHYSFGTNQLISGNTIELNGDGISDAANNKFSTEVGMQSNTSGGAVYNGLQITNNIVRVLGTQDATNPSRVRGIWENGHAHSSNITVSGNQFVNMSGSNNPATNLQQGFWVSSHSSASTTVTYSGNSVSGANIGFKWVGDPEFPGQNYSGNQAIRLTSNTIVNNGTGVLVQHNGLANLKFNRIVGNTTGINNVLGTVDAENNWWGCNYGPGAGGAGCSGTANGVAGTVDANPWLTMTTSASPSVIGLGDTSTVTSLLRVNSDNVIPVGGAVPNGIPASYTATLGTVSPTSSTTSGGVVGTTFFTANAFGTGGVNTILDAQTVNAAITITASCPVVSSPSLTSLTGQPITVPVETTDLSGRGVMSADFTVTYNNAVVTSPVVSTTAMTSGALVTVNDATPGVLVISVLNDEPFSGSGPFVNIGFSVVGLPGTSSPIAYSAFKYNEGSPCSSTTNGLVTVISGTISGTVTYGNVIGAPAGTRYIPDVTLNAVGSVNTSATTGPAISNGQYTLSGMGAGAYTVTPSKVGGVSNNIGGGTTITSFDPALLARYVVGLTAGDPPTYGVPFAASQISAMDVSGTGGITSFDGALIARWVAGLSGTGNTAAWVFTPTNRSYPNVNADWTGQDYSAILMGDVSGNYDQNMPVPRPAEAGDKSAVIASVPTMTAQSGSMITVPVTIGDTTNKGVVSYQFELSFDPEMIEPAADPVDLAGTMSEGYVATVNALEPGLLRVVVFGALPFNGEGNLINLRFNIIGKSGVTDLGWNGLLLNEGNPRSGFVSGRIRVMPDVDDEDQPALGGRVLTANGQAISGAVVTVTDTTGKVRSVVSNVDGVYRVRGIQPGQAYTITVEARQHAFTPIMVSAGNRLTITDLIAN